MKKKILLYFFCILAIFISCILNVDAEDIGGGGTSGAEGTGNWNGSISDYHDIGMRVTIYDEKGNRVSKSVDVVFAQNVYNRFVNNYGPAKNTLSSKYNSKVDYIAGKTVNWSTSSLANKIVVEQNHSSLNAAEVNTAFPGDLLKDNAYYWYKNIDIKGKKYVPENVTKALGVCEKEYKCSYDSKYYAVFEPTMYVYFKGSRYYGTAYELAQEMMYNNSVNIQATKSPLDTWINQKLPRSLVISGEYKEFYKNIKITEYCSNWETCLSYTKYNRRLTKETILNKGVGMSVYDWTENIPNLIKNISCDVNVNIKECGESSIYEASNNNKECIVGNAAYLYMDGCNLYCSDTITTDFNGFYGTFIGNNALKAIKSGKYISIKSNPKITISKTCYQSSASKECSDVSGSFRNKLNSDYRTNKIYLNIDGKKYDFIGNSTITNNGYSSATITYEYKLDENVNKYIDIETMKGVLTPSSITYTNEGPMIITSKGYYGTYTYNFDVSETPLNKYTSSSSSLRKIKNEQSGKYNFQNKININYSNEKDNKKTNYTNEDLKNTTCSYIKYNTETSCIGEKDKCVDSVTCEVLNECPPNPDGENCTCTGEYGCLDDGKCTPITNPTKDDGKDEVCDPETKTCFPDVIYRPISLVEPFPGKDGNKRTPGNNWNKIVKTADGRVYSYGDYYIRLRRGYKDYEIYQTEPLYVIKLDGNKIQAIRKYNDKHDYNDFELTCINGENCVSNFLRGATQDFTINLIDSGTCKNINSHNFDSCIKNKGE